MQGYVLVYETGEQHYGQSTLERITILETQYFQTKSDLDEIKEKLDQLLQLKYRGLGALWLVGLFIGSGIIGFLGKITGLFGRK